MNKTAIAYKIDGRILIIANAQTVAGFYVHCEPFIVIDADASAEEIGRAIVRVFDAAQSDVPIPTNLKLPTQRRLKAAGVKSEAQLQMRAVHCLVTQTQDAIWIEPTHNGGTRGDEGGFQFLPDQRIVIALNSSLEQIGGAVLDGFARSTSVYTMTERE